MTYQSSSDFDHAGVEHKVFFGMYSDVAFEITEN